MDQTANILPSSDKTKDKPLDESAVDALEMAFQDEIIDSTNVNPGGNYKRVAQILIIIIVVMLLCVAGLFISYGMGFLGAKPEVIHLGNENAGYSPILDTKNGMVYKGKIFNSVVGKTPRFKYELLDDSGTLVVYLYSDTIDLDIAKGLTVGIKGIRDIESFEGVDVINVKEVEFQ